MGPFFGKVTPFITTDDEEGEKFRLNCTGIAYGFLERVARHGDEQYDARHFTRKCPVADVSIFVTAAVREYVKEEQEG